MKVLKDNNKNSKCIREDVVKYPRKLICDTCLSELEYEEEDMRTGALGCMFINCPCCGRDNLIDDENGITLTVDNVEFPTHFFHTSTETGAVDCCNNESVKKAIKDAIAYFRKHKNEFYWFTATGNLYIGVSKWDGDESYEVVVTNDYYETLIPFEREDY